MESRYLSIDEVAQRLDVSDITVRRWVKSGKLDGRKAGAQWRFDPSVVEAALDAGTLEGASRPEPDPPEIINQYPVLNYWRGYIEHCIDRDQPKHVIANDRRGAKIWDILKLSGFRWGFNLWHSTALDMMTLAETRRLFGRTRVLLFDEMMRYGEDMHKLRTRLEAREVGAHVTSLVCVRNRSKAESGDLSEYQADRCEDLPDRAFNERATFISDIVHRAAPPLDVDHLVVEAKVKKGFSDQDILQSMMNWGMGLEVWKRNRRRNVTALTLDRPQFFNTDATGWSEKGFVIDWAGPCKIRLYVGSGARPSHCSFVTYPNIEAPTVVWRTLFSDEAVAEPLDVTDSGCHALSRAYRIICMDLSIRLLRDFVSSGAAGDLGLSLRLGKPSVEQLRATYGPSHGAQLAKDVKATLSEVRKDSSPHGVLKPPPLLLRKEHIAVIYDTFGCHRKLFTSVLPAEEDEKKKKSSAETVPPISYRYIVESVAPYAESTVSQVLDDELDIGTISPKIVPERLPAENGREVVHMRRGYKRGEFEVWFGQGHTRPLAYPQIAIRRTHYLGPAVVDRFIKLTGENSMTARDFDKVFVNLQHDLNPDYPDYHELLYLGWMPYKYGPLPVVPVPSPLGQFKRLERFLVDDCQVLEPKQVPSGQSAVMRYTPKPGYSFDRLSDSHHLKPTTIAHVKSLVRLYAEIRTKVSPEALTVLAAVRNQRCAYANGWYQFHDWRSHGETTLFPLLKTVAELGSSAGQQPLLTPQLRRFAAPGGLLRQKLDAYRDLPKLRQKIDELVRGTENLEFGGVLLDAIDKEPRFERDSTYPLANLRLAEKVMRPFSSLVRQVATSCGVDKDERPPSKRLDDTGQSKDAAYYLGKLFKAWPELQAPCGVLLRQCIDEARGGVLTPAIANELDNAFQRILKLLDTRAPIPDPPPAAAGLVESRSGRDPREEWYNTLRLAAGEEPCAIAMIDISRVLSPAAREASQEREAKRRALADEIGRVAERTRNSMPGLTWDGRDRDIVALRHASPDELLAATLQFLNDTAQLPVMAEAASCGWLGAGVALYDPGRGDPYKGIRPWRIAAELARDIMTSAGSIIITEAVYRLLTGREDFAELVSSSTGQGPKYLRMPPRGTSDLQTPTPDSSEAEEEAEEVSEAEEMASTLFDHCSVEASRKHDESK